MKSTQKDKQFNEEYCLLTYLVWAWSLLIF